MAGSDGGSAGADRGLFITFEGGDGAGKSTQIRRLAGALRRDGYPVTVSREPGGTPGAEAVRHVVLDTSAAEPFGPYLEAMLFAAARNDHVEQTIRPALKRGEIVLVDRFMDSTRVYQGASENLDSNFVRALERVAIADVVPDLTIILDLSPGEGLRRAHARRDPNAPADRFEKEDVAAHEIRRQAFLDIAEREPARCRVVDASREPEDVAKDIARLVAEVIEKKGIASSRSAAMRDSLLGAGDDRS
ncbi:dTMP kinase [Oricola sp.]|uniref:dTMP kinase n=1 Tax=Oricola sp. TaxID=1979950 RepID=UPI00320BC849|nr:dTMP kinase [Oricola sp.]